MPKKVSKKITVLTADDEPLARAGIRTLLAQATDLEIVGEAKDGFEVQELIPKLRPKILLLDYQMPGPRAYQLEKWVRENCPETTTLILTAHDRDAYLAAMIDSGVAGYLLKDEKAEQLIGAIRRAAHGEILFDQRQFARAAQWREEVRNKLNQLTPREHKMLELLKNGLDNKAIAQRLDVSTKTVMYHMTNLFRKLQVKNRQEATLWAMKHLLDNPDNSPG
jgi:DNA-binding NarL/FixJ family response regulator